MTVHFKCRICLKDLPKSSYWKKHYSFHTDDPQFPCKICGKSFKQTSDLRRHEKIHNKTIKPEERPFSAQLIKAEQQHPF